MKTTLKDRFTERYRTEKQEGFTEHYNKQGEFCVEFPHRMSDAELALEAKLALSEIRCYYDYAVHGTEDEPEQFDSILRVTMEWLHLEPKESNHREGNGEFYVQLSLAMSDQELALEARVALAEIQRFYDYAVHESEPEQFDSTLRVTMQWIHLEPKER